MSNNLKKFYFHKLHFFKFIYLLFKQWLLYFIFIGNVCFHSKVISPKVAHACKPELCAPWRQVSAPAPLSPARSVWRRLGASSKNLQLFLTVTQKYVYGPQLDVRPCISMHFNLFILIATYLCRLICDLIDRHLCWQTSTLLSRAWTIENENHVFTFTNKHVGAPTYIE